VGVSVGGEGRGAGKVRKGTNGEGECEGRGAGAPHAKTRNTRNTVAHRLLAWLLAGLLAGMVWDGMGMGWDAMGWYGIVWPAQLFSGKTLNQGPRPKSAFQWLPRLWLLLQLFTELPAKAIYDSLVT
jgi:hypothetical protein